MLKIEITEVVLADFNIVNKCYQLDSGVFYTYFSNNSFW